MTRLWLLLGDLLEVDCSKTEAWRRIYAGVNPDGDGYRYPECGQAQPGREKSLDPPYTVQEGV